MKIIRASKQYDKGYWYLAKHGIGPGTIPAGVKVLDVEDHPENKWKCYILLDRMLTTDELNEYELKEEAPEGYEYVGSAKKVEADSKFTLNPEEMMNPGDGRVNLLQHAKRDEKDRKEKEAAAAREKKNEELRQQYANIFDAEGEPSTIIDDWFEELVPAQGKADTVAGEIVRALGKIRYRWYNDGDIFFMGYGRETAGPSAAYLMDKVPGMDEVVEDFADNVTGRVSDADYEVLLAQMCELVVDYIKSNPADVMTENTEDNLTWDAEALAEYEPMTEVDVDIPSEVYSFIENGDISTEDVMDVVMDWVRGNLGWDGHDIEVSPWLADAFRLENVSYSVSEEVEDIVNSSEYWDNYIEDLRSEYGDPDGEEDEEDEEEYEED